MEQTGGVTKIRECTFKISTLFSAEFYKRMHTKKISKRERVENRKTRIQKRRLSVHTPCLVSTFYTSPDNRADTSTDSTWPLINEPRHSLPKLFLTRNISLTAFRFPHQYGQVMHTDLRTQSTHWVMHRITYPTLSLSLNTPSQAQLEVPSAPLDPCSGFS